MRRTVRFRITLIAAVAVAAMLIATGIALVLTQRQSLRAGLDETVEQRADDLGALLGTSDFDAALENNFDEDVVIQLIGPDGAVLAANPPARGIEALGDGAAGERQAIRTVDVIDDAEPFRVLFRRVVTPDGDGVLVVGGSLDDVREATRVLAVSLLIAIPVVIGLVTALTWWLVGRTLRPVESIRREVATISGTDLHRRVPDPATGDEIAELAATMNDMLDRIEESSSRQQQFVADASHELRSPLTRIRAQLEVDLSHPGTADADETHRRVLTDAIALQALVDDLLQLARVDAGAGSERVETVDLDDLVLREAQRLREGGRVEVDASGVSAAQVTGDPTQLRRIVRNLADNAQRHAASRVTFTLGEHHDRCRLEVTDDGPGIAPGDEERIFERFTRIDDARTAGEGGAGLGLAIVRELVERHGGRVEAVAGDGGRFVVEIPFR